jgi:effector-binding domain-containing protein
MSSPTVTIETVSARKLAAVRRSVKLGSVGAAWKPALDLVWAFLRAQPGLRTDGHNVFLYHHPARRDLPMDVDFGVEVVRTFEPAGDVYPTDTPAGEVATAVHVGGYDQLRRTHDAIHAWRANAGRAFAGTSWEIYGDWSDDPSKLETTVCYLLQPAAR